MGPGGSGGARAPRRLARTRGAGRLGTAAFVGYLVGTFPSADLAAALASGGRTDLRDAGSGNPGAANTIRVFGPRWGYGVMAADVGKGVAASVLGRQFAGDNGAHVGGTAAVIGHCFPVWNGFRGGKGVAAGVGQCAATLPGYVALDLAIAAFTTSSPRWKQRAFASTVISSAGWVGASLLWWRRRWPNLWGPAPTIALPLAATASSAIIIYRFVTAPPPPAARPDPLDVPDEVLAPDEAAALEAATRSSGDRG